MGTVIIVLIIEEAILNAAQSISDFLSAWGFQMRIPF